MKLDNETKSWLDDQARQGCNQRDVAPQLMDRLSTPDENGFGRIVSYEQAVNLYKSARKRVRKNSIDMSIAKTQIQCNDDEQVYVHHSPTSVTSEPNGAPAGILIPVEADDLRMLQVSPEGPEQAPEASLPSQATPPTSEAPPEPPVNDPSSRVEEVPNLQFSELFPGLIPSQVPDNLSLYVSEVVNSDEQKIGTARATYKPEAPQVKNFRDALSDYIEDVATGGLRHPIIEEHYADDADLVDRLVSLLGSGIKGEWDSGTMDHDRILALFKDFSWETAVKVLGERLGWRWDFAGTLDKRALFEEMCDKIAEKLTRQPSKDVIESPAADPNNDRYDRIYEAQLGMYNGIRDLTDAVRALPIASVIAAKDETIAAKDAELETLREYVRHLQRQIGAA